MPLVFTGKCGVEENFPLEYLTVYRSIIEEGEQTSMSQNLALVQRRTLDATGPTAAVSTIEEQ